MLKKKKGIIPKDQQIRTTMLELVHTLSELYHASNRAEFYEHLNQGHGSFRDHPDYRTWEQAAHRAQKIITREDCQALLDIE